MRTPAAARGRRPAVGGGPVNAGPSIHTRPHEGAPWCQPMPDGPMPEGTTMTSVTEPSYSHGASGVPLLGETIGANLRRVAASHPDREAVVDVPTGRRWTYARLDADRKSVV